MRKVATLIGLLGGLTLGVVISRTQPAAASRNASGTYSLPSGNPVVSGTTISPTVHNNTMSDVGSELTDSLSRSGKGGMSGQFKAANGTVAAPGISFDSDTDCGLYRIGANNVGLALSGSKVVDYATTGVAVTGTFSVSGATTQTGTLSTAAGITATQSTSNGNAGTFTGNGSGSGVNATGGSSNGAGITATGGATNGSGGVFAGTGTGNAVQAGAGHLKLTGSNPTSTTAFSNTVTPMNIPKAWGSVSSDGGGNASVNTGFNIASATTSGGNIRVTFAQAFSNTNYRCIPAAADANTLSLLWGGSAISTTVYELNAVTSTSGAAKNCGTGTCNVVFDCFGAN